MSQCYITRGKVKRRDRTNTVFIWNTCLLRRNGSAPFKGLGNHAPKKQMHLELPLQPPGPPPGHKNTENDAACSFRHLAWDDRLRHFFKTYLQEHWVLSSVVGIFRRMCVGLGLTPGMGSVRWPSRSQHLQYKPGNLSSMLALTQRAWCCGGSCNPNTAVTRQEPESKELPGSLSASQPQVLSAADTEKGKERNDSQSVSFISTCVRWHHTHTLYSHTHNIILLKSVKGGPLNSKIKYHFIEFNIGLVNTQFTFSLFISYDQFCL